MSSKSTFQRISRPLYLNVLKRNSTFIGLVVAGGLASEMFFDGFSDGLWKSMNKGKLWEDVAKTIPVEEEE